MKILNDIRELQNPSAEAGIICTLIYNPDFYFHGESLSPKMFYDEINGYIYYAIGELAKKDVQTIDAYNISMVLSASKFTSDKVKIITPEILNDIISEGRTIARSTVEEYLILVKNVINTAFRREIFSKLQQCESLCFQEKEDDLQNKIFGTIDKTLSEYSGIDKIMTFGEIVDVLWQETMQRYETNGLCGIPSKISQLGDYFSYEKEELVLACAARKEGKSIWCMNEAIDKLEKGFRVVYFDTEMSDRQHMERMLAYLTKIPTKRIKNGDLDENEKICVQNALVKIKSFPYTHIYMTTPDMNKVYSIIKRMAGNGGVDFVIYDYIKSQNSNSSSEIYNMLGDYCNFLKNRIAGELQVPVLACAQLNRSFEIADSFKLEQFSSVVMLLKRKKQQEIDNDGKDCGNYKLFIKLNRLGEQMSDMDNEYVDVNFIGNTVSFEECKQHTVSDDPY